MSLPTTQNRPRQGDLDPNTGAVTNYDITTGQRLRAGQYSTLPTDNYNVNTGARIIHNTPITTTADIGRLNSGTPSVTIPNLPTATGAEGLSGYIGSNNTSNSNFINDYYNNTRAERDNQKKVLDELYKSLGTATEHKATAYDTGGVTALRDEVQGYKDQIDAEQLANRRRIEAIRGGGGSIAQGNLEADVANRQSISKQADLAILQNNSLRRYDIAKDVADQKVQAELEPLKLKIEYQQSIFNSIANRLTTAERDQVQSVIDSNKQQLTLQKDNKEQINKIAIEYGQNGGDSATQAKILKATTPEEAIQLAGNTLGSTDRQYKLSLIDKNNNSTTNSKVNKIFSPTQSNKGAINASLGIDEFNRLSDDIKNFYINTPSKDIQAINNEIDLVKRGNSNPEDTKKLIDDSNLLPSIKDYLKKKIDDISPISQGVSIWSRIKDSILNFFGGN
jgi:hypothetical protein